MSDKAATIRSIAIGQPAVSVLKGLISEKSQLIGASLSDADLRNRLGVIVLAIRRADGHLDFNPGPSQTVSPGDFLIAMGDSQKLKELETLAGV